MKTDPREFYDSLASDYHLIFDDWEASVLRQSAVIHSLLGGQPQRVLDVACGIGTQAIGLTVPERQPPGWTRHLPPVALQP